MDAYYVKRTAFTPVSPPQDLNQRSKTSTPAARHTQSLAASKLSDPTVTAFLDEVSDAQAADPASSSIVVQSPEDLHAMMASSTAVTEELAVSHTTGNVYPSLRNTLSRRELVFSTEYMNHHAVTPRLGSEAKQFLFDMHNRNWDKRRFAKLNRTEPGLSPTRAQVEEIVACGIAAILFQHYKKKDFDACRVASASLLNRCANIIHGLRQDLENLKKKTNPTAADSSEARRIEELIADIRYMVLNKDMPRAAVSYIASARQYLVGKARRSANSASSLPLLNLASMLPSDMLLNARSELKKFHEVTYDDYVYQIAPDLKLHSNILDPESTTNAPAQAASRSRVNLDTAQPNALPKRKCVSSTEYMNRQAVTPTLGDEAKQFLVDLHHLDWDPERIGTRMSKLFYVEISLGLTRTQIEEFVACGIAAILYFHDKAKNPGTCTAVATGTATDATTEATTATAAAVALLNRCATIVSELKQYLTYLNMKENLTEKEKLEREDMERLIEDIQYMVLNKDLPRAAIAYIADARQYLMGHAAQLAKTSTAVRFSWHPLSYIPSMFPIEMLDDARNNLKEFNEVTYDEYEKKVAPEFQWKANVSVQKPDEIAAIPKDKLRDAGSKK